MKKINILVVPSDNQGGVGFYRSTQPHIQLEQQYPDEFSVTINMNPNWYDLTSFRKYQIIHIHKGLYQDMEAFHDALKYFKEHNIVTIMDIDDHWKLDYKHPQYHFIKEYKIDEMIKNNFKHFDYITTTTEIFRKEILPFNKNVVVFPNAINPEDPRFQIKKEDSERLRIGMIMGSTHEYDMALIGKISEQLTKEELDKVQFVLCGYDLRGTIREIDRRTMRFSERPIRPEESVWYRYEQVMTSDYKIITPEYKDFLLKFIPNMDYADYKNQSYRRCWTKPMDSYYQHFNNVDVLLAPLDISEFNKVKSPLKVAECVFSKTAIIASDFGPYSLDLRNAFKKGGEIDYTANSLLVEQSKNNKHWLRFIKLLINNRELVKNLQDNLYNDLHEKYDLRNVTKDRAIFYNKIVKERQV
jgi:glycosyltransferase involved in cell wall biosynthesis